MRHLEGFFVTVVYIGNEDVSMVLVVVLFSLRCCCDVAAAIGAAVDAMDLLCLSFVGAKAMLR